MGYSLGIALYTTGFKTTHIGFFLHQNSVTFFIVNNPTLLMSLWETRRNASRVILNSFSKLFSIFILSFFPTLHNFFPILLFFFKQSMEHILSSPANTSDAFPLQSDHTAVGVSPLYIFGSAFIH